MKLYNNILEFGDVFNSVRMHEDFMVVDLKLPITWEDKKIISSRGGIIQMKIGNSNETHKLVSFFNVFTSEGCDVLVEEIKAIIKWNKDIEEKNNLLNLKMLELKKVFVENSVDSLRKLNFEFNKNNIELGGKEKNRELVSRGSIEGPTGGTPA